MTSSRQITDLLIEPGYAGGLVATTVNGNSTSPKGTAWNLSMNNLPLTKNGTAVNLTWNLNDKTFIAYINDFYNALLDTYQPAFPRDPECIAAGHCSTFIIPQEAAVNFPALNLTLYFGAPASPQPAPSTVDLMDVGLLKLLPFGTSANLLKLDPEGPTASVVNIAGSTTTCVYKLGQQFSDFDSTCVQAHPASDPNQANDNATEEAKLFGGFTHSDEAYSFDLSGIDPQFVASSLAPTAVVADGKHPADTDVAYSFRIDTQDLGTIANDYVNNDTTQTKDYHGIGLLTLELAQMVQAYMTANYGVNTKIGDKACMAAMGAAFDGAGDVIGPYTNPAGKVCSGIEGIVTTAPTASAALPINALGPLPITYISHASKLALGMKPGTWSSLICFDGNGFTGINPNGYNNCLGGDVNFNGQTTDYFDTLLHAVMVAYSGNAQFATNPSPGDLNNKRFYFQQWVLALAKYLQSESAATAPPTLATIDAKFVDPNDLFLDSAGAGFDNAQYVFRNNVNVGAGQAPTVLAVTVELNNSSINDFEFDRWNFRGESLLYSTLQADPTTAQPKAGDKPGAEPVLLSNLVGSPLLTTVFGTGTSATTTAAAPSGYACALAAYNPLLSSAGCTTAGATITDDLTEYAPSFGTSALAIAPNGSAPQAAPITVTTTGYELIQSAMVSIATWSSPYDPTSATATDPTPSALLHFLPKSANSGFQVAIDGSRLKFYNTNETTFSGLSLNGIMDWEYVPDPSTPSMQALVVRGFESQNFLGKVYLCAEASPTVPGPDRPSRRPDVRAGDDHPQLDRGAPDGPGGLQSRRPVQHLRQLRRHHRVEPVRRAGLPERELRQRGRHRPHHLRYECHSLAWSVTGALSGATRNHEYVQTFHHPGRRALGCRSRQRHHGLRRRPALA